MNVLRLLLVLVIPILLTGCATNKVSGKKEFRFPGANSKAVSQGKKQYAPMRQSQGGDLVIDPELTSYVNSVGQKLARASRAQNGQPFQYEFKVINSSVPNAWALPGGKIALNRGLLTEMNSEAELAAVLGHEIVHAAAEHSASQMSKGMLLQGAMIATQIGTAGEDYAQLAQMGAGIGGQMAMAKFGRKAELESDHYGMQYMAHAGYDPQGAVDLQETFVRLKNGGRSDFISGLFASHPPSQERVDKNRETATTLPTGGKVGTDVYMQKTAKLRQRKPAYEAYDKGRKALTAGNLAQAQQLANQALQIEPRESHFHALKGDIALKQKNANQALAHFDKAVSLNDGFFYNHLKRGLVHAETGNKSRAKQDLKNSLKLLPSLPAVYYLGDIAQDEGDYNSAKKYFAQVAKSGSKTSMGQAAYGSLVDLDLPDNPSKYIQARTGVQNGQLVVQVSNPTPRDISGIVLGLQLLGSDGNVQRGNKSVNGTLRAGSREVIPLGVSNPTEQQVRSARAQVMRAKVRK